MSNCGCQVFPAGPSNLPPTVNLQNPYGPSLFGRGPVASISNTPDVTPTVGMRRLIGTDPTGDWSDYANQVAEYFSDGWHFSGAPASGQRLIVQPGIMYAFGTSWKASEGYASLAESETSIALLDAACVTAGVCWKLDTDILLSANTIYSAQVIGAGGIITRGTYTLSGDFWAPPDVQMFDAAGTGLVTLTNGQDVNVGWFGAAGDASTDDTNAIQQAILAVGGKWNGTTLNDAYNGGGVVYLQAKRIYRVTDTLRIPAQVVLRGLGTARSNAGYDLTAVPDITALVGRQPGAVIYYDSSDVDSTAIDIAGYYSADIPSFTGTITAATTTTITLDTTSADDFTGGEVTCASQTRQISAYDTSTKIATVGWAWSTTPATGAAVTIVGGTKGDFYTGTLGLTGGNNYDQTSLPKVSYPQKAGVQNLFIVSSNNHKVGLRVMGATEGETSDLVIFGFKLCLERVSNAYTTFRNIVCYGTVFGTTSLYDDQNCTFDCVQVYGGLTPVNPTSVEDFWFLSQLNASGTDTDPLKNCANYMYKDMAAWLNCDGELYYYSYKNLLPQGNTFLNCHFENATGTTHYHQSGGQATWTGGTWTPVAGTAAAFGGVYATLSVSGICNMSPTKGALIGTFDSNSDVRVRDVPPYDDDSAPTAGGPVWWDAYATSAWTPSVAGGTTDGTWTDAASLASLTWNYDGRATIDFCVDGTLVGATGAVQIRGVPIVAINTAGAQFIGSVLLTNVTISSGYSWVVAMLNANWGSVQLMEVQSAGAEQNVSVTNLPVGNFKIRGSISYRWK